MKKIISFLLCAIMAVTCSFSVLAAETPDTYEEKEIVEFIYEEEISPELKAKIEAHLLGESKNSRGILCTIFGHDLVTTATTKITHKARTTAPRCLEETYRVETCEDCDYVKSTLIASSYINCCA